MQQLIPLDVKQFTDRVKRTSLSSIEKSTGIPASWLTDVTLGFNGATELFGYAIHVDGDWWLTVEQALAVVASLDNHKLMIVVNGFLQSRGVVSAPQLPDFKDPASAARAWADEHDAKKQVQHQLAISAPKAEAYDFVCEQGEEIQIGIYAKNLSQEHGFKVPENGLRAFLRNTGYLMEGRSRGEKNRPYSQHVPHLFIEKRDLCKDNQYRTTTYITGEGQLKLAPMIVKHFDPRTKDEN